MAESALTRRRFVGRGAALGMALAAPFLGGCTGSASPPGALRVYLRLNPYERAFFERTLLPSFERERRVRVELLGGTSVEILEAIRAGEAQVDLVEIDIETLGELIAGGLAQEVSGEHADLGGAIARAMLPALEQGGRRYALPYRPAAWITYTNGALLEAAGVSPPATWEEVLVAATRLRDREGRGLVALQGAEGQPAAQSLIELIWAFGGDPFHPADGGALAAGDYLARLAPLLAPLSREAKFDSMTMGLGGDQVALGPNWPVVATDLIQRGGKREIGAYAGPAGPAGAARLLSGAVLIVSHGATNRAAALALAAHLRSPAVGRLLVERLAWTSIHVEAFDAAPEWQRVAASATREALRTARALPPLRDRETFDAALGDAFRAIAFGSTPPGAALTRAAERIRTLN